ncbi:hypothetical protein FCV25MIE_26909 [Fagus crenata]
MVAPLLLPLVVMEVIPDVARATWFVVAFSPWLWLSTLPSFFMLLVMVGIAVLLVGVSSVGSASGMVKISPGFDCISLEEAMIGLMEMKHNVLEVWPSFVLFDHLCLWPSFVLFDYLVLKLQW